MIRTRIKDTGTWKRTRKRAKNADAEVKAEVKAELERCLKRRWSGGRDSRVWIESSVIGAGRGWRRVQPASNTKGGRIVCTGRIVRARERPVQQLHGRPCGRRV